MHSPRQFVGARIRERNIKEQQHKNELGKAGLKKLKAVNRLYNDELIEQKREAAAEAKVERDRKKGEERKAFDKEKKDREKQLQSLPKGKRTTPQSTATKKQKRSAAAARSGVVDAPHFLIPPLLAGL